jgi:hypothetical protein
MISDCNCRKPPDLQRRFDCSCLLLRCVITYARNQARFQEQEGTSCTNISVITGRSLRKMLVRLTAGPSRDLIQRTNSVTTSSTTGSPSTLVGTIITNPFQIIKMIEQTTLLLTISLRLLTIKIIRARIEPPNSTLAVTSCLS